MRGTANSEHQILVRKTINMTIKLALPIFFFALFLSSYSNAEVIKLKNGREIEGAIVKETKDTVLVDIGGGEALFYKKGILSIDRTKADETAKKHKSELAKKAEDMNSLYYSYPDSNVETVEFVFASASDKDIVNGIKKEDYSDAADKLDNMKLVATYDTAYDRLYTEVVDRPFFEEKKHRDSLDAMIKTDRDIINSFWNTYKPYVTKLIDTGRDIVKSVRQEGVGAVVETLNEERVGKKFVFNAKNELQSIESVDERYKYKNKETPKFEQLGTKYLIKSLETETQKTEAPKPKSMTPEEEKKLRAASKDYKLPEPELPKPTCNKFEIEYQVTNGVKVPKSLKFSFQNDNPALSLPGSGSMEFSEIKVRLKADKE